MEIELKYAVPDRSVADRIWDDGGLQEIEEPSSRETLEFSAAYYDTEDRRLFQNDIAFRMRKEGRKLVAALKWNGENQGALHKREELNINLGDGDLPKHPDPSVFSESEEGRDMVALLESQSLSQIMSVNVVRRSVRLDTGNSMVELSLDDGEIVTDRGREPVCEMEIELYSGSQEEMETLGSRLAETYGLRPETRSKFARGWGLLGTKETKE